MATIPDRILPFRLPPVSYTLVLGFRLSSGILRGRRFMEASSVGFAGNDRSAVPHQVVR
jgi:hypothetical protein